MHPHLFWGHIPVLPSVVAADGWVGNYFLEVVHQTLMGNFAFLQEINQRENNCNCRLHASYSTMYPGDAGRDQPSCVRAHNIKHHIIFPPRLWAAGRKRDFWFMGSTTGILNTIMWPDSLGSTTDSDPCGGKVVIVSAMPSPRCALPKRSPCGRLRRRIATGKWTVLATPVQTMEDKHKPVSQHVSVFVTTFSFALH